MLIKGSELATSTSESLSRGKEGSSEHRDVVTDTRFGCITWSASSIQTKVPSSFQNEGVANATW